MKPHRDTSHAVIDQNTVVFKGSESECEGYVLVHYTPGEAIAKNVYITDRRVK